MTESTLRVMSLGTVYGKSPDVFERFSDRGRKVVVLSQEIARQHNHNYIGTEHVLVALIAEGGGEAYHILKEYLSQETVEQDITTIIGDGMQAPTGHINWNTRAKKLLDRSFRESLIQGVNYVGTEHILAALIKGEEGIGYQILIAHAPIASIRTQLKQVFAQSSKDPSWTAPEEQEDVRADITEAIERDFTAFRARLLEHMRARDQAIEEAEATWLAENSSHGAAEAQRHELGQQLADLLSRGIEIGGELAASQRKLDVWLADLAHLVPINPDDDGTAGVPARV